MRGENSFDSQLSSDIRRSLIFVSDLLSIRPGIDLRSEQNIYSWSANAGLSVCWSVSSEYFTFFVITQSFFMLGPPDFAWKQIQIVPTDDDDEYDNNDYYDDDDDGGVDDDDDYNCKAVNFQARTSRFCMVVDLNSSPR